MADYWTIQTLNNADGLGRYHEQTIFIMPLGQNGAAAGKYFLDNGGTAPGGWTVHSEYRYSISKKGEISLSIYMSGGNPGGAGAGALFLAMPYTASATMGWNYTGGGVVVISANTVSMVVIPAIDISASRCYFTRIDEYEIVQNSYLDQNYDSIRANVLYKAF